MTMEEVWKDIKGFEGKYQVSNMGRVRSLDRYTENDNPYFVRGRILKLYFSKSRGYYKVGLSDGHRNYTHYEVHRLVALHFVPGYKRGLIVNHINEIKTDNRASNLEWCTYKYNLNYSDVVAWKRKTVYQYTMGGDFIKTYKCCSEVEKDFGMRLGAMVYVMYESKTGIWKDYRWSYEYITKEQWMEIIKKHKSSRRPIIQLNEDGDFLAKYRTITEASKKFGVSITAISNCCSGKTYHCAGFRWEYEKP